MSLTSLAELKTHLGVAGDAENASLAALIRAASDAIRRYCRRNFGGVVSAISVHGSAAVVTCYGHGLKTGDAIELAETDSTPTLDGARTVTVLSPDTFSVPVATNVTGATGSFARSYTEFYAGNGTRELLLRERPVLSVASVYEDAGGAYGDAAGAFGAGTELASGSDYCLDGASGILLRIGGVWPAVSERLAGLLSANSAAGLGNIKVTYTAGYAPMPYDLRLAACQLAAAIASGRGKGGPLKSESLDYYSYALADTNSKDPVLGSVRSLLAPYKSWVL